MIKHVVIFRLKGEAGSPEKTDNINTLKNKLESLPTTISQIISLETGVNTSPSPNASDLILITEFKDNEALEAYRVHPDHQSVLDFIVKVKEEIRVVDYYF